MTVTDWFAILSAGFSHYFSPSGHAVAMKTMRGTMIETMEVHFQDGREPILLEESDMIVPKCWISDIEILYYKSGMNEAPSKTRPASSHKVFSINDKQTRHLLSKQETMSIAFSGKLGKLSVLTEAKGKAELCLLDGYTGTLLQKTEFAPALDSLEVYELFGHSWSEKNQEVALIGWPYDYLEEGIAPTAENSQWLPVLDDPPIQDYVITRPDGSTITQREMAQKARYKRPHRLFLLNTAGDYLEVPDTLRAHYPCWSPDSSLLVFQKYKQTHEEVWLLRRSDLTLHYLGQSGLVDRAIVHPDGILFCKLMDETIPMDNKHFAEQSRSAKWQAFRLWEGQYESVLD